MEVVDTERNAFAADAGSGSLDVDLAGTVPGSDVVPRVTAARPPRVFLLDGVARGGAVELLPPGEWARLRGGCIASDAGLRGAAEPRVDTSSTGISAALATAATEGVAVAAAPLDPLHVPTLPRTLALPPAEVNDGDDGGPAALHAFLTPLVGEGLGGGRGGALVQHAGGACVRGGCVCVRCCRCAWGV